jgi:putative iron-dependent peroxidase
MPFGDVGKGEFGTYFIGYARSPSRIERMLKNMFVGDPPGNYDRLLDVSRAVTGSLFFVPPATFLDDVAATASTSITPSEAATGEAAAETQTQSTPRPDGSLRIGSLKEEAAHE